MKRTRPDLAERNRARAIPDAAYRTRPSEYSIWRGMVARCHNICAKDYARYGARGVYVCERWRESFDVFLTDMGPRPSLEHQIDRLNNDGPYSPDNCAWRTASENSRNRRSNRLITCFGECLPLVEWAKRTGISRVLIAHRLRSGWSTEEALTVRPSKSLNSRHRRTKEVSA